MGDLLKIFIESYELGEKEAKKAYEGGNHEN